jgi:hypothetical protein
MDPLTRHRHARHEIPRLATAGELRAARALTAPIHRRLPSAHRVTHRDHVKAQLWLKAVAYFGGPAKAMQALDRLDRAEQPSPQRPADDDNVCPTCGYMLIHGRCRHATCNEQP